MSEAATIRFRRCKVCRQMIGTTAAGMQAHVATCKGAPPPPSPWARRPRYVGG